MSVYHDAARVALLDAVRATGADGEWLADDDHRCTLLAGVAVSEDPFGFVDELVKTGTDAGGMVLRAACLEATLARLEASEALGTARRTATIIGRVFGADGS